MELLQSRLLLLDKLNDIEPNLNNKNLVWNYQNRDCYCTNTSITLKLQPLLQIGYGNIVMKIDIAKIDWQY